jgi:hypothetical protein
MILTGNQGKETTAATRSGRALTADPARSGWQVVPDCPGRRSRLLQAGQPFQTAWQRIPELLPLCRSGAALAADPARSGLGQPFRAAWQPIPPAPG